VLLEIVEDLSIALEFIDSLVGLYSSEKLDGKFAYHHIREVLAKVFGVRRYVFPFCDGIECLMKRVG
jgi:hypothetical protein